MPPDEEMGPSARYLAAVRQRMEVYDSLCAEEAALVDEYGLERALRITRQFYGRWDEARAYLEAERKALQVQRCGNIPLNAR